MINIKELVDYAQGLIAQGLPVTDRILGEHFGISAQAVQQRRRKLQKDKLWPIYPRYRPRLTTGQMLKNELQRQNIPVQTYEHTQIQNYLAVIDELRAENETLRRKLLEFRLSHAGAGVPGLMKMQFDGSDYLGGTTSHNIYKCRRLFSLPALNINARYCHASLS